jgi:hypothetical protein
MTSQGSLNCDKLRDAFEGREAIYVERGVLRVRVSQIRCFLSTRRIDATVEEVPTPGLASGLFEGLHSLRGNPPLRWKIRTADLSMFSEHTWDMGDDGGWSRGCWTLYFAPEVVSGLTNLAATWPVDLDNAMDRHKRALAFLMDQHADERSERVFPD